MRPTEDHPRAWIEHHKLQYGSNWRAVAHKFTKSQGDRPHNPQEV